MGARSFINPLKPRAASPSTPEVKSNPCDCVGWREAGDASTRVDNRVLAGSWGQGRTSPWQAKACEPRSGFSQGVSPLGPKAWPQGPRTHWRLRGLGSSSKERVHRLRAMGNRYPSAFLLEPRWQRSPGKQVQSFWCVGHLSWSVCRVSEAEGAAVEVVETPFRAQAPVQKTLGTLGENRHSCWYFFLFDY